MQILFTIIFLAISVSKCLSEISTANNQFGLKLYTALAPNIEGDFVLSTFPISTLFGLLYSGTNGKSTQELKNYFEFLGDSGEVANDYRRVIHDFEDVDQFRNIKSQLFLNKSIQLIKEFETTAQKHFLIDPITVNFAESNETVYKIKEWVQTNENNLDATAYSDFFKLLKNGVDENASISLVTKSFFNGSWVHQFNPLYTKPSPFYYDSTHANLLETMFQRTQIPYAEISELDSTAIALPYKTSSGDANDAESRVELIVLLPNSRTGLKDLESKLKTFPFSQITRQFLETKDLFVYLPKFSINTSLELSTTALELGLKSLFNSDDADFSNMIVEGDISKMKISNVFQFAKFSVDEVGTVGIPSTVADKSINHNSPESFRVNRPFIGFLYDQDRHIILNIFRKIS